MSKRVSKRGAGVRVARALLGSELQSVSRSQSSQGVPGGAAPSQPNTPALLSALLCSPLPSGCAREPRRAIAKLFAQRLNLR